MIADIRAWLGDIVSGDIKTQNLALKDTMLALSEVQFEQLKKRFQDLQKVNEEQALAIAEKTEEAHKLKTAIDVLSEQLTALKTERSRARPQGFTEDTERMIIHMATDGKKQHREESLCLDMDMAFCDATYHTTILEKTGHILWREVSPSNRFHSPDLETGYVLTSKGVEYAFQLRQRHHAPPPTSK